MNVLLKVDARLWFYACRTFSGSQHFLIHHISDFRSQQGKKYSLLDTVQAGTGTTSPFPYIRKYNKEC
jgi:hypothetical protein